MNRKPLPVFFVVLLALAMIFSGCRRSASPELPDEEGLAQEAAGNVTPVAPEEPAEPPVDPVDELVPPPTEDPTPEPVEEPTEVPPLEPTVEPPAEPTEPAEPPAEPPTEPAEPAEPVAAGPGKHIVQPGENLFRIALRYSTTVGVLANANGIANPARIYVGQELVIPDGEPGTPPPSPPPANGTGDIVHEVQPGENLFRIALRYNYDQFYIARYNGISNPAMIYAGQRIRIPRQ